MWGNVLPSSHLHSLKLLVECLCQLNVGRSCHSRQVSVTWLINAFPHTRILPVFIFTWVTWSLRIPPSRFCEVERWWCIFELQSEESRHLQRVEQLLCMWSLSWWEIHMACLSCQWSLHSGIRSWTLWSLFLQLLISSLCDLLWRIITFTLLQY